MVIHTARCTDSESSWDWWKREPEITQITGTEIRKSIKVISITVCVCMRVCFTCLDWAEQHWGSFYQTAAAFPGTHCKRTGSRRRSKWLLLAPPAAGEWMRGRTGFPQSGKWQKKKKKWHYCKANNSSKEDRLTAICLIGSSSSTQPPGVHLPEMWVCPGPFPIGFCQVKCAPEEPCPDCRASFGCSCSSHWSSVSFQVLHLGRWSKTMIWNTNTTQLSRKKNFSFLSPAT